MPRRGLSAALLVLLVFQVLAVAVFVPVCADACSEDDGDSCPPVCTLCTNCPHAQQVPLGLPPGDSPLTDVRALADCVPNAPPLHLASDIFHVPLPG